MGHPSPPLEGVVVIVIDAPEAAKHIEKAFANAGAATFVATNDDECRALLQRISPHFAIVDPTISGGGPQSMAWTLLSHPECRTVIFSSNVHGPTGSTNKWLISKSRPASDVVRTVTEALKDPTWIAKGGEDVKPAR